MSELDTLVQRGHGVVLVAGPERESARPALWDALSQRCESLYLVGPLHEKPVPAGAARVWLLECDAAQRASGIGEVSRRDAHGIHVIGPADARIAALAVRVALSGSLCALELDAPDLPSALEQLRGWSIDAQELAAALLGSYFVLGDHPTAWIISDAGRQALLAGASTAEILDAR